MKMVPLVKFTALCSFLAFIQSVYCSSKVLFIKQSASHSNDAAALSVTWDETNVRCDIISGKDQIEEHLKLENYISADTITEQEMQEYLQDCDRVNKIHYEARREIGKASETESKNLQITSRSGLEILPGTKWCGKGDEAENYDDLGYFEDADKCCRAHDFCNDTLAPNETRNGLTNNTPYTTLSCYCDEEFYNCLSTAGGFGASLVGSAYFNDIQLYCYKKDYPEKCKIYKTIFKRKVCIVYEKDTEAPQVYMWVRNKEYKK